MTNREAIKFLEWIKNTHPEHITQEAIDLAISALDVFDDTTYLIELAKSLTARTT